MAGAPVPENPRYQYPSVTRYPEGTAEVFPGENLPIKKVNVGLPGGFRKGTHIMSLWKDYKVPVTLVSIAPNDTLDLQTKSRAILLTVMHGTGRVVVPEPPALWFAAHTPVPLAVMDVWADTVIDIAQDTAFTVTAGVEGLNLTGVEHGQVREPQLREPESLWPPGQEPLTELSQPSNQNLEIMREPNPQLQESNRAEPTPGMSDGVGKGHKSRRSQSHRCAMCGKEAVSRIKGKADKIYVCGPACLRQWNAVEQTYAEEYNRSAADRT